MSPALTIKDSAWETQLFRARVAISLACVCLATLVIAARMAQLQIVEYQDYKTQSDDNRVKIVPVPPTRGLVFDRTGVIMAQNTPTYSLEVVPEHIEDMDALIDELGTLVEIREADVVRFRRLLGQKRRFDSVPLRLRLDEGEVARFAVNSHRFPGVDVHARLARSYPNGALGSHLVGYVGRINEAELERIDKTNYRGTDSIGKTGIELAFEAALHGTVGFQHVETNARGRTLRVLERVDPRPGSNIHLTLDASLQRVAEQALGEENGAVVVIEPATGAVLAFASMPTFDLNSFVDGIDVKSYRELLGSTARPLFNRALNGRYPPGSTVKPFMALAGLEEGAEHAHGESWCPGWFRLPGKSHRYRDWKRGGHGRVGIRRALVESCDVYFYELALELGIDRMHRFMTRFGFGRRTGIGLRGESSGLMPSREWKRGARGQPWYPGETLITGIGQGFMLATPLQLASATATLSMRGVRLRPQVVLRRESTETGEVVELEPETIDTVTPQEAEHWDSVIEAMVDVVHGARGTARAVGKGLTYKVAGKTGTAQVFTIGQEEKYEEKNLAKKLRDHGLFIAFAPADRPRIAVAVLVENGGGGSRSAAPVARKVLEHYLGATLEDDGKPLLTASAGDALDDSESAVIGLGSGSMTDEDRSLVGRLHLDVPLLVGLLALAGIGLVVLYSAGGESMQLVTKQAVRLGIAFGVMFTVAQLGPRLLYFWAPWLYAFGLVLLVAVLVAGDIQQGAQRWLRFGGASFQPSEMAKITVPLMVAYYLSERALPPRLLPVIAGGVLAMVPTLLIAKQPDLGTSLLIGASGIFVLFLAGMSWRIIALLGAFGAACAPALWYFMHDYQRQRVLTFLDPEQDPLGSGYHIIQSKIAIGSGGSYGKGWLNGTQSQLEFLPERTTDFIFSVLGEEFGFMGVLVLLVVYVMVVFRGLHIAQNAQDGFGRLVAGSITLTFFVYVFVNIGMVSGLLPVVGLPLPLVSYGGTSLVTVMAGFGILMSIQTHRRLLS